MFDVKIDSIIPYMAFGDITIAAFFFTFFYYYVKDIVLERYRNFLWATFGYILFKEFILVPKYTQEPLFLYCISEIFYWGSLILYIRFIYVTIDFKEKKNFFRRLSDIAQLLHVFAFVIYMYFQIVLPEYKALFGYIFAPISVFIFTVVSLFIRHLYKGRILVYYRFLYIGSILFLIFNTLSLFFNSPDKNFYGLTNFSILCISWFLELMMFMIALCMKAKNEWDEKLDIIENKRTIEKKLLLQEIERQNTIYESRHSERLKISIDIHDGISNAISGLKFYINDKRLQSADTHEKALLKDLEGEVNSIYTQVRSYIQQLYSGENGETYNIIGLLETLQKQYNGSGIQFTVNIDKNNINKLLSGSQLNEFYFILYEIIGNAIKHSYGNTIDVNIYFDHIRCYFSVRDNGKGFDYNIKINAGLGLSNVKERINKLSGEIEYHHLKGTAVSGSFPLILSSIMENRYTV